jgi:hypothetical protein
MSDEKTKRVQMTRSGCSAAGALNEGKIYDLPVAQADDLVRSGYAKTSTAKKANRAFSAADFDPRARRATVGPAETRANDGPAKKADAKKAAPAAK